MINAGFNPLQQISEKTGKSIAQLKEEMSKGAISAEMVQQAFLDATAAGGKFYNMSENASKTINGQISMLQDALDSVFNDIGTKSEGVILKTIQATTSLIQNYEKIGSVLTGLVATYGTYRTAVFLATAATSKHTIAEVALINVRIAARKAQKLLNAAMMTNPYVALATAVAGLAAAMWTLRDNTTAAEKAQKSYNEYKENSAKKEKEHKDAIQKLVEIVRDDTNAIAERESALISLKNEYPNIFALYDTESVKLADILSLNKQINEEMSRRKQAQALVDMDRQKTVISQMEGLGVNDKRLDAEKKVLEDMQKAYLMAYSLPEYIASLEKKTLEELEKELGGAQFMSSGTGVGLYNGMKADKEFYDSMAKAIQTEIESRKTVQKMYSDVYEEKEKTYNEKLAEFKWAEENKTKITLEEYQKRKAAKDTAEKEFKAVGGDPKEKEEKDEIKKANEQLAQQERMRSMLDKNARDNTRAAKDNAFMVEQARIDAMKEGHAKTRAQMALDHQKELENLERQKQDYVAKVVEQERAIFEAREDEKLKNNPKYKKQAFDSAAVEAKVDTSAYDKVIKSKTEQYEVNEGELLKNLFTQYMSYTDQKEELEREYLDDVLALNMAYLETGDEKYKRGLDERTKAYIKAKNDLEKDFGTEDYRLVFGDPSKMTSSTIEKALEVARKKLSELDKEADPETFKAYAEAIDKLEDARDSNPFEGWGTSVMGLIQKLHQIRNIRKDIKKYEENGNKEAKEGAEAQLEKSKKDLAKALVGTGVAQFGSILSTAAASMREVAEASGDIDLMEQAEALEKAGGFISSVASGAASGGWVGAIIGGASSLMDMVFGEITELEVAMAKSKKAREDYLDEIARSRRQINEEDYETIFGVRALEKVVDASKAAQKAWEDYQKAMNTTYGDPSRRDYVVGLENIFKRTSDVFPKMREVFENIFTYETDDSGRTFASGINLEEAKMLLDAYRDDAGHNQSAWYKGLEDAVNALEDYEKNAKVVDNYLASLFSNVGSDIADAIMQGNDALEVLRDNAGDIFASIAKDMIMSTLMSTEFIEDYKKRLRDAMATEGAADDADVLASFVDELGQRIGSAQEKWTELQKIAEEKGIDLTGLKEDTTQQSASRGYQNLSEDTGGELVGRAIAQYESNLRIEASVREAKEIAEIMAAGQVQIKDIAAESRALIADSYLELQQIRENTGAIIKPIKNLSDKIDNWDSKIMSL